MSSGESETEDTKIGEDLPDTESVRDQISALISDAQLLAKAELDYYKARISFTAGEARSILILFGIGAALIFAAIIGLIVGGLLILAQYMGFLVATGIIVGSALAVAAFLIWRGAKRLKNLSFSEDDI